MTLITQNEKINYLDFIFEKLDIKGYEKVYKVTNKNANLLAIVAIHDTTLGVSLGGIRIKVYSSFDEALFDVLRLSKGMTYKSAIPEVGLGGGKSVIILKDPKDKTKKLLEAFGKAVNFFNGEYICAEDLGCFPEDLSIIRTQTKYVVGLSCEKSSGDPSRFTAWGVFRAIQATLKKLYNSTSLENKKIAIQGLGSVGMLLANYLFWNKAELIVTDINEEVLKKMTFLYGAKIVKPQDIYKQHCDIFSPCAIGGVINDETIKEFNCKAICGAANNQLLEDRHADILRDKNILYAPDFIVNVGGILSVAAELDERGYHPKQPRDRTDKVYDELLRIFKIAEEDNISTHLAAIQLAEHKIKSQIGKRKSKPYFHH